MTNLGQLNEFSLTTLMPKDYRVPLQEVIFRIISGEFCAEPDGYFDSIRVYNKGELQPVLDQEISKLLSIEAGQEAGENLLLEYSSSKKFYIKKDGRNGEIRLYAEASEPFPPELDTKSIYYSVRTDNEELEKILASENMAEKYEVYNAYGQTAVVSLYPYSDASLWVRFWNK